MTQMISQVCYLLWFDFWNFNFGYVTLEFIIFLQLNHYCKTIIKFLMKNKCEEYDTTFEKDIDG